MPRPCRHIESAKELKVKVENVPNELIKLQLEGGLGVWHLEEGGHEGVGERYPNGSDFLFQRLGGLGR